VDGQVQAGQLFQANPQGYFSRVEQGPGRLAVPRPAAARNGRPAAAGRSCGCGCGCTAKGSLGRCTWARQVDEFGVREHCHSPAERPGAAGPAGRVQSGSELPQPLQPSTTIPFSVPALDRLPGRAGSLPVAVEVYDALGQRVRTLVQEERPPGYYRAIWDGRDSAGREVGSGIYFCRVRVGEQVRVRKMALVK